MNQDPPSSSHQNRILSLASVGDPWATSPRLSGCRLQSPVQTPTATGNCTSRLIYGHICYLRLPVFRLPPPSSSPSSTILPWGGRRRVFLPSFPQNESHCFSRSPTCPVPPLFQRHIANHGVLAVPPSQELWGSPGTPPLIPESSCHSKATAPRLLGEYMNGWVGECLLLSFLVFPHPWQKAICVSVVGQLGQHAANR